MKFYVALALFLAAAAPRVESQTCQASNLSCDPSLVAKSGKGKVGKSATLNRLVPICIVKTKKKGKVTYRDRCIEEQKDPKLKKDETFFCGYCPPEVPTQAPILPPNVTEVPTLAPFVELPVEPDGICETELTYCVEGSTRTSITGKSAKSSKGEARALSETQMLYGDREVQYENYEEEE